MIIRFCVVRLLSIFQKQKLHKSTRNDRSFDITCILKFGTKGRLKKRNTTYRNVGSTLSLRDTDKGLATEDGWGGGKPVRATVRFDERACAGDERTDDCGCPSTETHCRTSGDNNLQTKRTLGNYSGSRARSNIAVVAIGLARAEYT